MTKEEFTKMYNTILAQHQDAIKSIFMPIDNLNPPDAEPLTKDFIKRFIDFFRKEVDYYIEKTFNSKDNDAVKQSLEILKELLLEYREKLILEKFPNLS